MDNLLLHPSTRLALEQIMLSYHHAVALVGPYGAGKGFLATKLAENILGDQFNGYKIFRIATQQAIGIEEIRALQGFLHLKTTGKSNIRRVVIIEDAHTLTIEAQNALLKTLEEPPEDTKLILTIADTNSLRKTVYSRLQMIHVQPCTQQQVINYFESSKYDKESVKKACLISAGYVGLCCSLVTDKEHDLVTAIAEAKLFLSANPYKRLIKVDELAKDKEKVGLFLFAAKRILSAAVRSSKDEQSINSVVARMKIIYKTELSLRSNPNMKLVLTDLALAI